MSTNSDITLMTLQRAGAPLGQHLACQIDTVNLDWQMRVRGLVPIDQFDIYSLGWLDPVPQRGDFFIDETTSERYEISGNVGTYASHFECRCTRFSGSTP